jgi:asparagine synthase (glutamine-hydrolysing)
MCGLVGEILFPSNEGPGTGSRPLGKALDALGCRGPDGRGETLFSSFGHSIKLGHTRLAILDLSNSSHQPFQDAESRYYLVFNGEIYNYLELKSELLSMGHEFSTTGDTEVLFRALIQWGIGALVRLEGMFSLAFFDSFAGDFLFARDRFGIKPFFWKLEESRLLFASEIQALLDLGVPSVVNPKVASNYLMFGWSDYDEETFFDGIMSLGPGEYLLGNSRESVFDTEPKKWWTPLIKETYQGSFSQAADELRRLVFESVELHMRSDVAVGSALSGGLDSSTLVSVMRKIDPSAEIHTFSFIDGSPEFSEERWVDVAGSSVGAVQHKISLSGDLLLSPEFYDMVRYQGEPFGSSSIFAQYQVFKSVNQAGIKVTLDGQGADELFAGYHGYPEHRLSSLIERGELLKALSLARAWSTWPGRKSRDLLISSLAHFSPNVRNSPGLMKIGTNLGFIPPQGVGIVRDQDWGIPVFNRSTEGFGRRLVEELRFSMGRKRLSALLRFADRNSMRWSVESRVPFLSSRIAEFSLSLPEEYHLSQKGEAKRLLREAMRGIVPDSILSRRDKVGFRAQDGEWLKGRPQALELIENLEEFPFIDISRARSHVRHVVNGESRFNDLTWRLVNFSAWAGAYHIRAVN